MIGLKDAVKRALEFAADVYGGDKVSDLLLEEIRLSEDERFWHVTVSFVLPSGQSTLMRAAGHSPSRSYKVIRIDNNTGQVKDMMMRGA